MSAFTLLEEVPGQDSPINLVCFKSLDKAIDELIEILHEGNQPSKEEIQSSISKSNEFSISNSVQKITINKVKMTKDFKLKEVIKDLVEDQEAKVIVQCISQDCAMGAGIAKDIKRKFLGIKDYVLSKKPQIGDVIPYEKGFENKNSRIVLNMVTKKAHNHKPTKDNFIKTLENLRDYCQTDAIDEICMPRIGCGLDKLDFETFVKPQIVRVFGKTTIKVTIYSLE